MQGKAGDRITLRHAEVLQDGELYTRPLRACHFHRHLHDCRHENRESWEPRFTIHGFRYAEVDGWTGESTSASDVVARVYHTDMERTGWFDSSDPDLNRLHENVVWSMRGNFVDIPTDCPQRDERLGWTGDIQVFAPTASFLYDCSGMLTPGSATSRSSSSRTEPFPGTSRSSPVATSGPRSGPAPRGATWRS